MSRPTALKLLMHSTPTHSVRELEVAAKQSELGSAAQLLEAREILALCGLRPSDVVEIGDSNIEARDLDFGQLCRLALTVANRDYLATEGPDPRSPDAVSKRLALEGALQATVAMAGKDEKVQQFREAAMRSLARGTLDEEIRSLLRSVYALGPRTAHSPLRTPVAHVLMAYAPVIEGERSVIERALQQAKALGPEAEPFRTVARAALELGWLDTRLNADAGDLRAKLPETHPAYAALEELQTRVGLPILL